MSTFICKHTRALNLASYPRQWEVLHDSKFNFAMNGLGKCRNDLYFCNIDRLTEVHTHDKIMTLPTDWILLYPTVDINWQGLHI